MMNCITQMKSKKKQKLLMNDYLLSRDMSRRVIKPPQRFGYVDLIAYALNSTSEFLDKEPRDHKEFMRSQNKTE